MKFFTLTTDDQRKLREERLRALECDLFRTALLLEENPANDDARRHASEIAPLIDVHADALGLLSHPSIGAHGSEQ